MGSDAKSCREEAPATGPQAFAAKQWESANRFSLSLEKGQQEPNFLLVEKMAAYYGIKKLSSFETYRSDERASFHHLNDL